MAAILIYVDDINLKTWLAITEESIYGLLNAIASIPIGQQKRKAQPRAIKRRPKAYPLLTEPRGQACEAINT